MFCAESLRSLILSAGCHAVPLPRKFPSSYGKRWGMEDWECSSEGKKGSRNKMRGFINCLLREGDGRHSQPSNSSVSQPSLSVWLCFFGRAPLFPSPPCNWKLIPGSREHPTLGISSLCPEKWDVWGARASSRGKGAAVRSLAPMGVSCCFSLHNFSYI